MEESNNKNSKILPIAIFLIIALGVGSYFYATKNRKPAELTGLEIAVRSSAFLDKALKPDGTFETHFACGLRDPKECVIGIPAGPPHTGEAILAYFELAQTTGDKSYREKADMAMEAALRLCTEVSEEYCEWNFFPIYKYYMETRDPKYLSAMKSVQDKFLDSRITANAAVYRNYGIKLGMLYEATGDEKYLVRLVKIADDVLAGSLDRDIAEKLLYKVGEMKVRTNSVDAVWGAYLPAYKATKDEKYLNAARDFFANGEVARHMKSFKGKLDLARIAKLAEAAITLDNIPETGKGNNRYVANGLLNAIAVNLLDSAENPKFNMDYGFLDSFKKNERTKTTLLSGWMIRLYLMKSEELFNVEAVVGKTTFKAAN